MIALLALVSGLSGAAVAVGDLEAVVVEW